MRGLSHCLLWLSAYFSSIASYLLLSHWPEHIIRPCLVARKPGRGNMCYGRCMLRWNRRVPWLQKKKRNTKDRVIYSHAMRWQGALSHTNQYGVSKLISCKRTFMTRISRIFKAIDKACPWQAATNTIAALDWPPSQSSTQIIHGKKSYNARFTLVQGNVAKQMSAFVKPVLAIKGDPFLISPFAGRMNNNNAGLTQMQRAWLVCIAKHFEKYGLLASFKDTQSHYSMGLGWITGVFQCAITIFTD